LRHASLGTFFGHNRPISAHFHSGGEEFTCFGDDLGEAVC
jgi:hypothetical protein